MQMILIFYRELLINFLAGLIIGPATIVIPIAHFVTTWAIPLLSVLIAVHMYRMGPNIKRIVGQCPVCDAAIDAAGGTAASDLWIRCEGCQEPLQPVLILVSEEVT